MARSGRRIACCAVALVLLTACGRGSGPGGVAEHSSTLTKTPPPSPMFQGSPAASPTGPPPTPMPTSTVIAAVPATIASASHPVVWYWESGTGNDVLVAFDWNGRRAGELKGSGGPSIIAQSPDGTRLAVFGSTRFAGAPVIATVPGLQVTWGRDDEHLCVWLPTDGKPLDGRSDQVTVPASLWVDDTAGHARKVIDHAQWFVHGGPTALACSVPDDRAIIGTTFTSSVYGMLTVRLSDGRSTATPPLTQPYGGVVASRDGRYLASGSVGGTSSDSGFDIMDTVTGAHLAHLTGVLVGFSDDGTRALVTGVVNDTRPPAHYSLIDWRTGKVYWSGALHFGTVLTRPHSGDFLLGNPVPEGGPEGALGYALENPIIVHADGSVATVQGHDLEPVQTG